MLKKLQEEITTEPSNTEYSYIFKLLESIKKNNILIIGPNGTGKTFIVKKAIEQMEFHKCYFFDTRQLIEEKGGLYVYQKIIQNLIGDLIAFENLEDYIHQKLIDDINEKVSKPVVLFFDHFQPTNKAFYNRFSNTCRKIYLTGIDQPKKGCNKITMVFTGTLILNDVADVTRSPIWDMTEKIHIRPHSREEADFNNYLMLQNFSRNETLLECIYQLTSGHKYLAKTVIQVIKAYHLFFQSEKEILEKYIDHLWKVLHTETDFLDNENRKLRFHFYNIIEYLETNVNILQAILDLHFGQMVVSEYPPDLDQIYITGLVNIDSNNQYYFSNQIYKHFITKLFEGYRAGDSCLFHAENLELWNRAKKIYQNLHAKKITRQLTPMLTNKRPASTHISHQIIQKLKQYDKAQELANEIAEILTLMYNISEWSIYRFHQSSTKKIKWDLEPYFSSYGKRVKENKSIKTFIQNVIEEKKQMIDWTGTWQGIPVMIGSDFNLLFVYKLISEEYNWARLIPTFVKDALMLYYNFNVQEKMSFQIQNLKDSIPQTMQYRDIFQRGEQEYWNASRYFLRHIGIQEFTLHEILDHTKLRSSNSSQINLTSHRDLKDIDDRPDLKQIKDLYRSSSKGEIINIEMEGKQLAVYKMQIPGNMIVIETHYSEQEFKHIQEPFYRYFKLIYQILEQNIALYQARRQINAIKEILEHSLDYIYIISYTLDIIFVNEILAQTFQIEKSELNNIKLFQEIYPKDLIDFAFQEKEIVYSEIPFEHQNRNIRMYTRIVPLQQDNNVFAVAVIMQDITYRHVLFEANQELNKIQNIQLFEEKLLHYLNQLGFEYVIPYKRVSRKNNEFINEQDKSSTFLLNDHDTHSGRVSMWYRKNYPENQTLKRWKIRFQATPYKLKEDKTRPQYSNENKVKDNFWITVPILYDSNVIKLFRMGWLDDKQWDIEAVYTGKLRLIESFARSVGQIWENISQKVYQTKFQNMITHGIIEPLQLMRAFLEPVIDMEDRNKRKKDINIADANLEIAQAALGSILSIYVGQKRANKEKICVNDYINSKLGFFQAYATARANIDFDISVPKELIICYTDPVMLDQIFNNLVGNSIRQLKKIKQEFRKIQIKLNQHFDCLTFEISDNGDGLTKEVKDYFYEKTFITKGMIPTGRLGIGFSKQIAEMLGGKLKLMEYPKLKKGTTYILELPLNED